MLRKITCALLALVFAVAISGCEQNETKVMQKSETQTESQPQDVSPGTMIVE